MSTDTGTKTTKMGGFKLAPTLLPTVYTQRERFLMDCERERCEARHKEEQWVEVAVYLVVFTVLFLLGSIVGSRYYIRNYGMPGEYKRIARMENELVVQRRELAAQERELAGERKKAREMQDFYHGKQPRDNPSYSYSGGGGEGAWDKMEREKREKEDTEARRKFEEKQLELLEGVNKKLRQAERDRFYDK